MPAPLRWITLLLSFSLLFSCQHPQQQVADLWIAAYYGEWWKWSTPEVWDLSNTDSIKLVYLDKDSVKFLGYSLQDTLFRIDTSNYTVINHSDRELRFGRDEYYAMMLHPVAAVSLPYKNEAEINEALRTRAWTREWQEEKESFTYREYLTFSGDQGERLREYWLNEVLVLTEAEPFCYRVTSYRGQHFLSFFGNIDSCEVNNAISGQILLLDKDKLNISYHRDRSQPFLEFEAVAKEEALPSPQRRFSRCDGPAIAQYYYNSKGTKHPDGNRGLLTKLKETYRKLPGWEDQNGWVRIRFIVNCKGETGRFSIQEIDTDHKLFQFDPDLIDQLLTFTLGVSGWSPGVNFSPDVPLDNYKHLTFKIEAGEVLAILP